MRGAFGRSPSSRRRWRVFTPFLVGWAIGSYYAAEQARQQARAKRADRARGVLA